MSRIENAIGLVKEKDTAAAIKELAADGDAEVFLNCMTELYLKQKDLPACIAIARGGIGVVLSRATGAGAEQAYALRTIAKRLCYNLASFTWDGWDEPGFAITSSDLAVGLDAANANLRLAMELNKAELALSRAYWMLAGHELSAGKRAEAIAHYNDGQRHAAAAKSKQDELLNRAFALMVQVLDAPTNIDVERELEAVKAELKREKDGEEFIRQVETAHRVFAKKSGK